MQTWMARWLLGCFGSDICISSAGLERKQIAVLPKSMRDSLCSEKHCSIGLRQIEASYLVQRWNGFCLVQEGLVFRSNTF